MPDGREEIQKELLKELEHHARHFCVNAEQLNMDLLLDIDLSVRRRLAETLQMVTSYSKEILEALNISCLFCRKSGGRNLGKCAVCGRNICSFCGQMADEKPVHIKVCALWYRKEKKGEE